MPALWLLLILILLGVIGYVVGRARAVRSAGGNVSDLHSLPNHYGSFVALSVVVPALTVMLIWLLAQPLVLNAIVSTDFPVVAIPENASVDLVMSDVRRIAEGLDKAEAQGVLDQSPLNTIADDAGALRGMLAGVGVALGADVTPEVLSASQSYRALAASGQGMMTGLVLLVALVGFAYAIRRTHKEFRARNVVEAGIKTLLIFAASIAILTTIGIVLSLIFNTLHFFRLHPASDFFQGLVWAPSFGGGSELGVLPLLWGTLYISLIALIVAVPVGLFAAIYLSEYATPGVRAFAKPLIEILAGIPTIVYGLFALLTVGPMLMSVFGRDGLGWMQAGTAVITAGLVMGIMLIPFVSSLSDDIINAVPQSLRDGSYALGSTQSETIRQVVLPAALPGIVGAILLAASRAIGETMIVVLGAGAAARLDLNPFEAMTTVTAKIVSQLTGDADFASPEALVAFALGMTLFVITLALNVVALMIVRTYREQYE